MAYPEAVQGEKLVMISFLLQQRRRKKSKLKIM